MENSSISNIDNFYHRNIHSYAWFQFASSLLGWLPVFFLYFNQYVGLTAVIKLSAIYYLSVCIFEVPSGYFSDRFGRRRTLLISGMSFIFAYLIFLASTSFIGLACGQVLLALGIAMMSGTDSAFLYDSLSALNRDQEYAEHEARGQKYGFIALSIASLLGGALGSWNLHLPYVLSLIGAGWMVWLGWRFVEPERSDIANAGTGSFIRAVIASLCYLKNPLLCWLFGVMVLMYCLEHVAYEFYQPYIQLLRFDWLTTNPAPLVSGTIIAASMFGGVLGAMYSVKLCDKIGIKALLFLAFGIQLFIISGLSFLLSLVMLGLVIFRNFPMAMIHAPVNAMIAPRVNSEFRATYLSIQSLSARLAFSILLYFLSFSIEGTDEVSWPALSTVLKMTFVFGITGTLFFILISPKISNVAGSKNNQDAN